LLTAPLRSTIHSRLNDTLQLDMKIGPLNQVTGNVHNKRHTLSRSQWKILY
jgi:hypothetical protein